MTTPSDMTRDELLVFNTMHMLYEETEQSEDIRAFLTAFEHHPDARKELMEMLTAQADDGFQRVFTVPPENERH